MEPAEPVRPVELERGSAVIGDLHLDPMGGPGVDAFVAALGVDAGRRVDGSPVGHAAGHKFV